MPIWQLCANLLIPNCLRSNLSYSPLAALELYVKKSKQLEKDGLTVTSDRGNIAPHPAIKIAKDAQIQAMKVMEKFGLTAKDRTKIAKLCDNSKELSPLEQFVKDSKEIR